MKMYFILLRRFVFFTLILITATISCTTESGPPRILVFSKTAGYRHEAIPEGIVALRKMTQEHNILSLIHI